MTEVEAPLVLNELIARCAADDEAALASLYEKTSPLLYGIALKLLPQKKLAEKVLQDTYVRVWHNASMYQSGRGSVINWLIGNLRYAAITVLRHMGTEGQILDDRDYKLLDEACFTQLLSDLSQTGAKDLAGCISKMEPRRARCLLLAYYHGLDAEQLSVLLEQDRETINRWLQKDLQQIKQGLS